MLGLVPGRADAEVGAPAAEYVEGRRGLDEEAGLPVRDAGDQSAQLDARVRAAA